MDFKAVCDAVQGARSGGGETMTQVAARFGVSLVGFGSGFIRLSKVRKWGDEGRYEPVDMRLPPMIKVAARQGVESPAEWSGDQMVTHLN